MTYEEACDALVTRDDAKREIERHGIAFEEFLADAGDSEVFVGSEILDWLGY